MPALTDVRGVAPKGPSTRRWARCRSRSCRRETCMQGPAAAGGCACACCMGHAVQGRRQMHAPGVQMHAPGVHMHPPGVQNASTRSAHAALGSAHAALGSAKCIHQECKMHPPGVQMLSPRECTCSPRECKMHPPGVHMHPPGVHMQPSGVHMQPWGPTRGVGPRWMHQQQRWEQEAAGRAAWLDLPLDPRCGWSATGTAQRLHAHNHRAACPSTNQPARQRTNTTGAAKAAQQAGAPPARHSPTNPSAPAQAALPAPARRAGRRRR